MNYGIIMRNRIGLIFLLILNLFLQLRCHNGPTEVIGEPFPNVIEENGRIFIVDITGERWDVTHAKQRYGMEPAKPQIGVGRTGVVPIMNPLMLSESDEAYPDDEDEFLILGSNLNGDTKAYPISRLAVNEVANDIMIVEQDIHVAFAY